MEQKVIQIGSSAGVTIPKSALEELGVKIGDTIETNIEKKVFSVRSKSINNIDPAILTWTNKFIEENRELLERLADK